MKWYQKKENWWIIAGSIIAPMSFAIPTFIMWRSGLSYNLDNFNKVGVVGDFIGGTTIGVLSLASMLFVIAAIVMQKEELRLQREELQLTRTELEKTREEHAMTNKTMKLQQFETTFFNMINLYNDILKDVYHPTSKARGREALKAHYEVINKSYFKDYVAVFVDDYMSSYSLDPEGKLKDYAEIIHGAITYNGKTLAKFALSLSLDNGISDTTLDTTYIYQKLIEVSEDHKKITYKKFDYNDFIVLSHMIPENKIVEEFMTKYQNTNYYKQESFISSVRVDDLMLSNYMKVIKMVLELIDGNDSLSNSLTKEEKKKYMKLFLAQFSVYETTLLNYYMKLGTDHVLKYFQDEYSIIKLDDILEESITL